MRPIKDIARSLGWSMDELVPYGHFKAKVPLDVISRQPRRAKLVLVTATNPTPFGEGKTTVSIGLADALARIGHKSMAVLREPSLGPVFGLKGGATGGGAARLEPSTDINLHFNGDFHAITAAHNLLAALIDNELYHGSRLSIKSSQVAFKRVLDVNDRSLRQIVSGLGRGNGVVRESGFDITAASEIMAIMALAQDLPDLVARLEAIMIASQSSGPITVKDLGAAPAMAALLADALMPNLVQTREGTPAMVHMGPFGNIAHGCNSVIATEAGLRWSDMVVTEAGFGADLGAEKFLDIKTAVTGRPPDAVVIVTTLRSLRHQGNDSLQTGVANLQKHMENIRFYGLPLVVAINRFEGDDAFETQWLVQWVRDQGAPVEVVDVFGEGGQGAIGLADAVQEACRQPSHFAPLYSPQDGLTDKIERIATVIYGAQGVEYSVQAKKKLERYTRWNEVGLGVCMAKTQYSLSDDPTLLGNPGPHSIHIRDIEMARGAGYIVPLAGDMVRMPGLPKDPAAFRVHLDEDGQPRGL